MNRKTACGAILLLATVFTPVAARAQQSAPTRASTAAVPGAPAGVTAFVHVSVVPMDTDRVLPDQTVLVEGGRITALGPAGQVTVPGGATRIDGQGKFLLPGLADMHAHIFQGQHIGNRYGNGSEEFSVPWRDSAEGLHELFLWLTNGATTIRNMDYVGDEQGTCCRNGQLALQFRARAAAGKEWLPRIYTAGQVAPPQYLVTDPGDASLRLDSVAAYVAAYKAAGYDFLKIHDEMPVVLDSMMAAAKRVGIPLVGHVPPPTQVEHILGEYKSIEHPVNDYFWHGMTQWNPRDTTGIGALAAAMRKAGVWNCPTQSHYDRLHYEPQLGDAPTVLKVLQDSGVKLLLGTDETPWIGGLTRELQEMVFAGLTPYQALLTGTRNVAEYFGTLNESGTVAVGKRADLVLLTGNPLADVRYTAQPAGVMLGGRWLSRAEIDRQLAKMTFPTITDGQLDPAAPVKSYWQNRVDLTLARARLLLTGIKVSGAQRTQYRADQVVHKQQWKALVDSLGTSDQYQSGMQRILQLLARQLADDRNVLTSDQRTAFDTKVTAWVHRQQQQGYTVTVPGVQP